MSYFIIKLVEKPSNTQKCDTSVFSYGAIQMKDTTLFTHLLGLSVPWKITAIMPDLTDKSITIQIDWPKGTKGALQCLQCTLFGLRPS